MMSNQFADAMYDHDGNQAAEHNRQLRDIADQTPTQPSTPLDDEVEQILEDFRLIHDVTCSGDVGEQTKITKKRLGQVYAKQFLELAEMQDEVRPPSGPKRNGIDQGLRRTRNKLRASLRAAVNKMVGAQDE